jgi:ribosomal protein S18 acetylase RimI-like enzyme
VSFHGGELFVGSSHQCVSVTWWKNENNPFEGTGNAAASYMQRDGEWYLNRVIIKPETLRSQGLGGELLERLKAEVARRGATRLMVEPGGYGSDPKRLQKFYRAHGFKRHRQGYYFWSPASV